MRFADKIETIKKDIWNNLGLIKVYTKQPGKSKDFPPIAMNRGSTIRDLGFEVHKDFVKKFDYHLGDGIVILSFDYKIENT